MEKGKIVFKGQTDKGREIIIRYPKKDDLAVLLNYINILSQERTFMIFRGEKISEEDETKWLDDQLNAIANKKAVLLLVFCDGQLIGNSGIRLKDKIEKHIGVLGISIAKDFRGEGIGSRLMELVIEEAKRELAELEIITLGVFSNNDLARKMYQKFGFVEYGSLPKGIKLENGYDDHIYMYKAVKI